MTKKLTPAVGYIRMSSGKQEASPGQQRAEIKKLAKRHNCSIVRWYFDEGISGDATEKRVAFRQMIQDAEHKRDFAVILCWDQSRFGRFDSIEAGRWIYPLRQAGVWLITVAEGQIDWNDFAGRMIYSIQQEGKHQYLIDLSRNVLRGKIKSAEQGRGANVPAIGYDRLFFDKEGKLAKRIPYGEKFTKPLGWTMRFVVSENTIMVGVVKWIFETFTSSDCSMTWLAYDLNRRGIRTPKGNNWSVQTIHGILTNQVYTGANVFGRNCYGKYYHTGTNGEIAKGAGHGRNGRPIVREEIHEVIIDVATFDRTQRKLAERSRTQKKPRYNRYLLSGVLRCGHCGGTLAGKGYQKGNVPRYYICVTGNTRPGACCRYQIQQEILEDYVLGVIHERLFSEDAVEKIRRAIYRQAKGRHSAQDATKGLKAQITTLDNKIAKGTENLLLANPEDMPDLSRLLAEWREERASLQGELERLATHPDGRTPEEITDRAMAELARLQEHFKTADPMRVRAVIKSMVEEVKLWWEPYGKRNKRLAHGVIQFRSDLELLSTGTRDH